MCNSVPIKANEGKLYLRILTSIMSIATAVSKKKRNAYSLISTLSQPRAQKKKNPQENRGKKWIFGCM